MLQTFCKIFLKQKGYILEFHRNSFATYKIKILHMNNIDIRRITSIFYILKLKALVRFKLFYNMFSVKAGEYIKMAVLI